MKTKMLWVGTSKNAKTGNIPQGYVGQTIDLAKKSCEGCELIKKCYHWTGSSQMGHGAMTRGYTKDSERYTLESALKKSVRSAKYARGAVGGDPSVFTRDEVESFHNEVKDFDLRGLILYTHFAQGKGSHLKGLAMGSCNNLSEADAIVNDGWRAAAVLPMKMAGVKRFKDVPEYDGRKFTTPEGKKVVICPAQTKRGVDCNSCGLCDATKDAADIIGFLQH